MRTYLNMNTFWLGLPLILAMLSFSPASHAQAEEADDISESAAEGVGPATAEQQKLRVIVNGTPPAGLGAKELWEFYSQQFTAAQLLGDARKQLEITRKWVGVIHPDPGKHWLALQRASQLEFEYGDIVTAMRLGDELVGLVPEGLNKARVLANIAGHFINQMLLEKGSMLIEQAQSAFDKAQRKTGRNPMLQFRVLNAKILILSRRSWLKRRQIKYAEAEGLANQQLILAAKIIKLAAEAGSGQPNQPGWDARISNSKSLYAFALTDVMQLQVDQGKLLEAATTAQTLLAFLESNRFAGNNLDGTYLHVAALKLAQNDLRRAEYYARLALKSAQVDPAGKVFGRRTLSGYQILISVLMSRRDWSAALLLQNQLDTALAGNASAARVARRGYQKEVLLTYSGQAPQMQQRLKKAADHNLAQSGANHIDTALSQGMYAVALAKSGQKDAARPIFHAAMEAMHAPDLIGAVLAGQGLRRTYRLLILEEYMALLSATPSDSGTIDEAFQLAEYLRGSSVQQSVVASALRASVNITGLGELIRREQDASHEIITLTGFILQQLDTPAQQQLPAVTASMKQQVARLQAERTALLRDILQNFPEYDKLLHPKPATIAQAKQQLGADEALISILPAGSQVTILAVSAGQAMMAVSPLPASQVDALVNRLRATLDVNAWPSGAMPAFDQAAAHELYKALLLPVAPVVQAKVRLVVAAGGSLGQIPFSLLVTTPNPASDKASLEKAAWLVRQASVTHIPSVSSWLALRNLSVVAASKEDLRKPFYGFGDPLFGAEGASGKGKIRHLRAVQRGADAELVSSVKYSALPALPETRAEIKSIAEAMGSNAEQDARFGIEASRKNVLATDLTNRKVIAFATHGLVTGDLPRLNQPALALAGTGDDRDSPLLTLEDVLTMRLNADWVVLSACNSAASDGQGSEAISGLGQGFFYAGAKALLVTHWAVETESANQLTSAIFRLYGADKNMLRAEALRQGQLELIADRQYAHPFFWAPYALVGDGGR